VFRNILVSVDGSQHAERALMEAIDIATAHRSRLTIMTAVRKPPGWVCASLTVPPPPTLKDDLERESRDVLEQAVARVPEAIPVTKILTHSPIRSALKREIATGRYDLLVMGSRGLGAVAASVLGSVSHYALNHLQIPVLIVRARKPRKAALAHLRPATPGRADGARISFGTLASNVNRARPRW
jgi:nucleotide-binding universal stress UspA family protein